MILHLVDDEKVINRTVEAFEEALPGQNHFLCFIGKGKSPKHVKAHPLVEFYEEGDEYKTDLGKFGKIVFHFLNYKKVTFCKRYIKHFADYYWIVWSGDLYNSILLERGYKIYSPDNSHLSCSGIKRRIFYILKAKYRVKDPRNTLIVKFVREKVRYIVTECEKNYRLISAHFHLDKDVANLSFFYYPIREILGTQLADKRVEGNYILLGNSASFTNNHEYILNIFQKKHIENIRFLVPLSYGGNEVYKKFLKGKINQSFPGSVILNAFLPLEEYNRFLLSAGICVFGNWRSEAYGNILTSLYLGAKVYLSNHNPLLKMLRDMGIRVWKLEEADAAGFQLPLSEEDRLENRRILTERYSKERMLRLIRKNFSGDVSPDCVKSERESCL